MIWLVAAFTALHVFFYLSLAYWWRKVPTGIRQDTQQPFSIVVPVRNEAGTIAHLLKCLEAQTYPKALYEVIVVDDFSEDSTQEVVNELITSLSMDLQLVQLTDPEKQGKKHALTAGVRSAQHAIILTTDADCHFGTQWLQCYNDTFNDSINMVAGPVAITGKGLFARLQQVEFAGLIGFGAVTISKESPSMCSGANLGFRKSAFEAVGGYTDNLFTPSGDDEFLLFNIMRNFPNSTVFLKQTEAVVSTPSHSRLKAFFNQRTRWTSKWKHNKNSNVRLSAVLFFLDYLTFYAAGALTLAGMFPLLLFSGVFAMRLISMCAFVAPINAFMKGKSSFWPLFVFQIIYPLHVLFMGMNSIFGSYTWKGRTYR